MLIDWNVVIDNSRNKLAIFIDEHLVPPFLNYILSNEQSFEGKLGEVPHLVDERRNLLTEIYLLLWLRGKQRLAYLPLDDLT